MSSVPLAHDHGPWPVFLAFLRLGLTSFGGPVAHLGYFRHEFVVRRQWLGEQAYADLVALCQLLPGPSSSQVGMALGLHRAGYAGAVAAWMGFTLPSALLLIALALGMGWYDQTLSPGWLQGLKAATVAVVVLAVWGMGQQLCRGWVRMGTMLSSAGILIVWPGPLTQVGVMCAAAALGSGCLHSTPRANAEDTALTTPVTTRQGTAWLTLFVAGLALLPWLASELPGHAVAVVDAFYRAGALVFGGGHVVLPLLESSVVSQGWVSADTFLAGYGLTQAMPGPLFTFAAFLGAAMDTPSSGWWGGWLALMAVFLPSFLLVFGVLPFWARWKSNARIHAALAGVSAAVVGLLLAALYDPVWTSAVHRPADMLMVLLAWVCLGVFKWPSWLVVIGMACLGWVSVALGLVPAG